MVVLVSIMEEALGETEALEEMEAVLVDLEDQPSPSKIVWLMTPAFLATVWHVIVGITLLDLPVRRSLSSAQATIPKLAHA